VCLGWDRNGIDVIEWFGIDVLNCSWESKVLFVFITPVPDLLPQRNRT
jgi:hypothetical protein